MSNWVNKPPVLHSGEPAVRMRAFSSMLVVVATLWPSDALCDGNLAIAVDALGGVEGGGSGYAEGVRRSRTTFRAGVDGWLDSLPNDALSLAMLVEVEPDASLGGELRYQRRFLDFMVAHLGVSAFGVPETLVGLSWGLCFRPELGDAAELNVGPMGQLFVAGSDLPEDALIWQALLTAGIRFEL